MRPEDMHVGTRRQILTAATSVSGLVLAGCAASPRARAPGGSADQESHAGAEVTPGEDLMQEHGVLERILLLYEEAAGRLESDRSVEPSTVRGAAEIVRRFVEDYHEALEEEHVFPRLEGARRELELVATLRNQHRRGRELTDEVLRLSSGMPGMGKLAPLLRRFSRMYRPHAAREDTVLFPAFRAVVGGPAYRELGEEFEEREHERLGERGFESTVEEVARLESALGISDLEGFTP